MSSLRNTLADGEQLSRGVSRWKLCSRMQGGKWNGKQRNFQAGKPFIVWSPITVFPSQFHRMQHVFSCFLIFFRQRSSPENQAKHVVIVGSPLFYSILQIGQHEYLELDQTRNAGRNTVDPYVTYLRNLSCARRVYVFATTVHDWLISHHYFHCFQERKIPNRQKVQKFSGFFFFWSHLSNFTSVTIFSLATFSLLSEKLA